MHRRAGRPFPPCPPFRYASFMLGSFFLNPWMLLGLSAALIPPIIHLLNRRRYETIDWGAMQFLQMSEVTRRRVLLEEWLLMLLRMGLIAALVLGVAGPFLTGAGIARLMPRANRAVVLVFDGSYSMGWVGKNGTPHENAIRWAKAFVADLSPGDTVAVLQAKDRVVPVMAEPSHDAERVLGRIDALPPPSGGCNWRPALQAAAAILSRSQRTEREIVLLSDGQRHGWADRDSLFRWSLLASEWGADRAEKSSQIPRLWVVNVAPDRPADPPNWSLTPLESNRNLFPAGRLVFFRAAIDLHGQKEYVPPYRLRLEIDGRFVRNLQVPSASQLGNGRVPFSFSHTFAAAGSHLVSVILEPDLPPEQRPPNYSLKDELPGDNRQDFALEVVREILVLIVDGGGKRGSNRADFLRLALEARDPTPVVQARVVSLDRFDPALLKTLRIGKGSTASAPPRALILRNVPRLTEGQQDAIAHFLADGGGVLVTLGPNVEADYYNMQLYRGNKSWLPARLEGIAEEVASPAPGGSDHPALRLFLDKSKEGQSTSRFPQLGRVRLPRWWKLAPPKSGAKERPIDANRSHSATGVQVASLRTASAEYPFLVEWIDPNRAGRLLLCAVPLDDSWGSELIRDAGFVPLVHELVYYLAAARSADFNPEPGMPLRHRLGSAGLVEQYKLQTPLGETKPLSSNPADKNALLATVDRLPQGALLRVEDTSETGVYRLGDPEGETIYYVVRPKLAAESDLAPCDDEDRAKVAALIPGLQYQNQRDSANEEWVGDEQRQEFWWLLLLGAIVLVCAEVWMTRRIVKNRG